MHATHFLVVLCLCIVTTISRGAEISFTPLGDLPGGPWDSIAFGVSADGGVAVGSGVDFQGNTKAFRWTSSGGMVDLGSLAGGTNSSSAGSGRSVSADGSVVIGYAGSSNAQSEAFRWTAETGMVGLGTLEPFFRSVGWAVSGDGMTVVGYAETVASETEAFRWTPQTGMVRLSGMPAGTRSSVATGASQDGSVVIGYMTRSDGRQEAFRWSASQGAVGLGFLPGDEVHSIATTITPDASAIVGISTGHTGTRAFRWTAENGMQGLNNSLYDSGAQSVSADGNIIAGNYEPFGAAIWIEGNGWGGLRQFLESTGIDLNQWHTLGARDVSADGTTLVGYGFGPRGQEGWIATIPEPSTWVLASVAIIAITTIRVQGHSAKWTRCKRRAYSWKARRAGFVSCA